MAEPFTCSFLRNTHRRATLSRPQTRARRAFDPRHHHRRRLKASPLDMPGSQQQQQRRRRPLRPTALCCLALLASVDVAEAAFTPPPPPKAVSAARVQGTAVVGAPLGGVMTPVIDFSVVQRAQIQGRKKRSGATTTRLWMAPITNARATFMVPGEEEEKEEDDEEEALLVGGEGKEDPNSVEAVKRGILAYLEERREDVLRPVLGHRGEGDLGIQWLPGGSTNYCFRVYSRRKPESMSLFVKHAKDFVRGFSEWATLSRERVWYDAEGIRELSKYLPSAFPHVYLCEPERGLLVCEWLEGYQALSDHLRMGQVVSPTIAPSLARMLARCHAASYFPCDEGQDRQQQQQQQRRAPHADKYPNQAHIDFWNKCVFPPLLDALASPSEHVTQHEVAPLVQALNRGAADGTLMSLPGRLTGPITRLWHAYEFKKQALVHADLHCKNILVRAASSLKVVDCEKWMSGPAGLDVGQLVANYAWYIAVSAVGCDRRETEEAMRKAVVAIWLTYTNEFRQALNKRKKSGDPLVATGADTEAALEDILLDAQGFIGMWCLFLCIACPVEIMEVVPPSARDTCQHTDPKGFRRSALTNIVCMAAALLVDYEEGKVAQQAFSSSTTTTTSSSTTDTEQDDKDKSEEGEETTASLFRAAEEASVRDMVAERNEARAAEVIDSYRSRSRTDPRRLLGVMTEGIYYSPAMAAPDDWGFAGVDG